MVMAESIYEQIYKKISESLSKGERPIVILDVDDTLVDCRYRKLAVIKDFAQTLSPSREKQLLETVSLGNISYRVIHCLHNLGIHEDALEEQLYGFWLSHYFTTKYLVKDVVFPRAAEFVNNIVSQGAYVVYLTARDLPGMKEGTEIFLRESRFPYPHKQTELMMKPEVSQADSDFKRDILPKIGKMGRVIASFENELGHLNHMADFFPDALMVWRNTQYAPHPPEPHRRVQVLEEF